MNEVLQKESILEHHLSSPNTYAKIYIGKIHSHFQANLVKDLFCQVECTPMEDWKTIAVKFLHQSLHKSNQHQHLQLEIQLN